MPETLYPWLLQGGAVGAIALLCYRLLRTMLAQANAHAESWRAAAEASDRRADAVVQTMTEMLSAMRALEALVRTQQRGPV